MLSICIPVYNHSFIELAKELHQQCINANVSFEIIISDDCSTDDFIKSEVDDFLKLNNARYIRQKINLGNDQNRNFLAKEAKYNWLLFLDADTFPTQKNFIKNYVNLIQDNSADAFSGGIVYTDTPSENHMLKWKHGKKTEELPDKLKPDAFLGFRGNNFLIKKDVFLQVPFLKLPQKYGYQDTVFGINLKLNGYKLILNHNPVEHNGLIDNVSFIKKTKEALEYAHYLNLNYPKIATYLKIIRVYRYLKKYKLIGFVSKSFLYFENYLYQNLTSKKPSLTLFQLYKIGYLCELASSKTANNLSS